MYCRLIPKVPDINAAIGDGRRKFVITGCGRSGTLYVRKLFLKLGVDLGHEGFRKDGIVSWYIAEHARAEFVRSYFKKNFPDAIFIHLVRNPVKVINSMYKIIFLPNRAGLDFFKRAYPEYNYLDGTLAHVMIWYLIWNQNCEKEYPMAERWKVENVLQDFHYLCKLTGNKPTQELWNRVKRLSTRTHTLGHRFLAELESKGCEKDFTFKDMYREEPGLAEKINAMASKYGYDLEERNDSNCF